MCCGESADAAISFVARSIATTRRSVPQKRGRLALPFSIFFALLALDAVSGVRQRVETLECDLLSAVMALAKLFRRPVKTAKGFVDMPEETSLLAGEKECLLALHRVRSLIGHVEGVGAEVAVRALRRGTERLVIVTELLQHAFALFHQSLLKMLQAFLIHSLRLIAVCFCCHSSRTLSRATSTFRPS